MNHLYCSSAFRAYSLIATFLLTLLALDGQGQDAQKNNKDQGTAGARINSGQNDPDRAGRFGGGLGRGRGGFGGFLPFWGQDGNYTSQGAFLGTTNAMPLDLRTNGERRVLIGANGRTRFLYAVILRDSLTTEGDALFQQRLITQGLGLFRDSLVAEGPVSFQQALSVMGNTHLHNALTVDGASTFNEALSVNNSSTFQGEMEVQDLLSTSGLQVNGTSEFQDKATFTSFRLDDGDQQDGHVLVSDASGNASWGSPSGFSVWDRNNSDVYYNAGNVGLNTNTPQHLLDVNGTARFAQDLYTEGNVGIGTTTPTEALTVDGDIRATGTVSADNLNFGGDTVKLKYVRMDSLAIGPSTIHVGSGTKGNHIYSTNGPLFINSKTSVPPQNTILNEETGHHHHSGNVGIGTDDPQRKLHIKTVHEVSGGSGSVDTDLDLA